jgi:DNA polymerase I-like protein with 3'-5' exonuclease and polymerase domains
VANKQVRTKIGQTIWVPDNVTDTSLLRLPLQANGADAFNLVLYLISNGLEGMDARIAHTQHDEIIVEARDGIEDEVEAIVKEAMDATFEKIIPEVPFVAEMRMAEAWG